MKRLLPCLLLVPLLTSCYVAQEGYYEPGYYHPAPRVEVHRYEQPHNHGYHRGYRPAPQARVEHGRGPHHGGQAVIVSPRQPQMHAPGRPNVHGQAIPPGRPNVHGPATSPSRPNVPRQSQSNVHGQTTNSPAAVVEHPSQSGPKAKVYNNVEAHN
ncbi:MAG: hypothetical protein P4L65_02030 [Legionella sp.]|nr:hypothetical protein [Legionella sp.]